jgi:hypothetical protein
MWEFFGKVIESLPPWFLMTLIVFLAVSAVYFLPRLRRDKNGKLYLFSRSYECQKSRSKKQAETIKDLREMVERLCGGIAEVGDRLSSVECEDLKQSFYLEPLPKDERLIAGLKYVYRGGNGSVREDVARFVAENPEVYKGVITRFPRWALARKD